MKRFLTLLALTACMIFTSSAQSVSPAATDEYCPMTDYTFTVTIPGTYSSFNVTAGAPTVVANPYDITSSSGTTTFKFKANFRDVNISQEFTVGYKNAANEDKTYVIAFKKIKSLFYPNIDQTCARITPNLPFIQAPTCQISTFNLSFSNIKFVTEFESPKSCFGSVTTYEYLLPSGWKLNSTTSNGTTWLAGDNNETITSDATTGNNGSIQIRATNSACSSPLLTKGQAVSVPVYRNAPAFTISPASMEINCTVVPTQTFTVSTTGTLVCPVTYDWNLGASNGWLLNGSPAPATFTTTDNFVTLTAASGTVLPSSVKVTPVLNGTSLTEITATILRAAPNYGMLGGTTNLCSGTSPSFYIYNSPSGSTYSWGAIAKAPSYNYHVVDVTTSSASSTTISKAADGIVDLSCRVENVCGQVSTLTRQDIRVGGYANGSTISGYTLAYPPCYTPLCTPPAVSNPISVTSPGGTLVYTGSAYNNTENNVNIYNTELSSGTWTLEQGTVFYWSSTSGNFMKFYPGGASPNYVKFRLTATTACGTVAYDFNFYPTTYSPPFFRVAPNPAKDRLTLTVGDRTTTKGLMTVTPESNIQEVTIFDREGRPVKKQRFGKGLTQTSLDVSNLKPGLYMIRIFDGKGYSTEKFVKE